MIFNSSMFRKKIRVDLCRARRLKIAHNYYQYAHEQKDLKRFNTWLNCEHPGIALKGNFLNECLEEYLDYDKEFPNGLGIYELIAAIPSDLMGEQGIQIGKREEELLKKLDTQKQERVDKAMTEFRIENGTLGSDFSVDDL